MASPQKENGYTPISNEILEKLAQTQISGNDRRILDVIIRKTYGFQKKQDKISLSQFVLATLLMKSVVCRGLNRLKKMNIIIRIANDNCTIYQFNKDFDTWKPLAKLLTLANLQTTVSKSANASLANLRHTKETTTKETLTKEISTNVDRAKPLDKRNPDVEFVFDLFETHTGFRPKPIKAKNGFDLNRAAALRMVKNFGREKFSAMMGMVYEQMKKDRYFSSATNPLEFEEKLPKFKMKFDQLKSNEPVVIL